jgi:hypothetical protein
LSDAKSVSEIFTDGGHDGSDESTVTPDDREDSASNRACSTAESLDVNDGRAVVIDVILGFGVEASGWRILWDSIQNGLTAVAIVEEQSKIS